MSGRTGLLVSLLVLLTVCVWCSQARYLPTRGDNSRREQIKEILRELLDMQNDVRPPEMEKRFLVKREALIPGYGSRQSANMEDWN